MKCNKSEKTSVNRLNTHLAHDTLILDSGIISNTNTPQVGAHFSDQFKNNIYAVQVRVARTQPVRRLATSEA